MPNTVLAPSGRRPTRLFHGRCGLKARLGRCGGCGPAPAPYELLSLGHEDLTPWLLLPGLFIIVTVLAFCSVGDGLRAAANPYAT